MLGARAASLVLGVVIATFLGRLLTTEELGVYASSFTLALVGSALAKLGLDRAVIRFVAGALGIGEPGRARAAIRIALGLGSAAAVVLGAIVAAGRVRPWHARCSTPRRSPPRSHWPRAG